MLISYFKIAWRNIKRNKLFSAINILGLSIGIALCFIIMLYVQDELSYDRFTKMLTASRGSVSAPASTAEK